MLKTSIYLATKKVSDEYKKIRQVNNVCIAKELQEAASKKKPKWLLRKSATNTKK